MMKSFSVLVLFILFFIASSVSAGRKECKTGDDDPDKGPTFPPPGAPRTGPTCERILENLVKSAKGVGSHPEALNGIFDSYIAFGPMQLTVKNTMWSKGWNNIRIMNDSTYFCAHDMYLNKYVVQYNVELPVGQIVSGDVGIWVWGANNENSFTATTTKPIIVTMRMGYDDAGGGPYQTSADLGADHGGFEVELKNAEHYCAATIALMEGELAKGNFEFFKRLTEKILSLFKDQDHP